MITPENWCPSPTPPSGSSGSSSGPGSAIPGYQLLVSSLCKMGWRPIMITGLLRDILTRHFATPDNVEDPDLKHLLWRPDEQTGVLVESVYRWRPELVEKRPAVLIRRNAYRNETLGINDMAGVTPTGHYRFATAWFGSHTLFCLHRSGTAADLLAVEVQRELTRFAYVIKAYLGLVDWKVVEVGEAGEAEEAKTTYVVPVTVAWGYLDNWVLYEQAPWLQRATLQVFLGDDILHGA